MKKVELNKMQFIHLGNICKKGYGRYSQSSDELDKMVDIGLLTKTNGPSNDIVYCPTDKGYYINSKLKRRNQIMKLDYERIIHLATIAKSKHVEAEKAGAELIIMFCSKETKAQPGKDAVHVLIDGKPLWLDIKNLRDKKLARRNDNGSYKSNDGEQHFTWENAQEAARKQGKRLITVKEFKYIGCLPRQWDDESNGYWITFKKVGGSTVDVFFPAAGYRDNGNGEWYGGGCNVGNYWSGSAKGLYKYELHFNRGYVFPTRYNSCLYGFSVRCVQDKVYETGNHKRSL